MVLKKYIIIFTPDQDEPSVAQLASKKEIKEIIDRYNLGHEYILIDGNIIKSIHNKSFNLNILE